MLQMSVMSKYVLFHCLANGGENHRQRVSSFIRQPEDCEGWKPIHIKTTDQMVTRNTCQMDFCLQLSLYIKINKMDEEYKILFSRNVRGIQYKISSCSKEI